jgi:hypothetical protein
LFKLARFPNKLWTSGTSLNNSLPPTFPSVMYKKYPNYNIYLSNVIDQYINILLRLCIHVLVCHSNNAFLHPYMNVSQDHGK